MTPAFAAAFGGTVSAAYVPILRGQIRDGEVGIPLGSINPVRLRRDDNPVAFRFAAIALGGFVALPLIACAAILIRSLVG